MSYRILISVAKVPEHDSQFDAKINQKRQGSRGTLPFFDLKSDLGIRLLPYVVAGLNLVPNINLDRRVRIRYLQLCRSY